MEYRRPPREKIPAPTNQELGLRPGAYSYKRSKRWQYYPDVFRRVKLEGEANASLDKLADEGAYCNAVLEQIAAVKSALLVRVKSSIAASEALLTQLEKDLGK